MTERSHRARLPSSPRNKELPNRDVCRSCRNKRAITSSVPGNRVVAKASVIHSPKKSLTGKVSLEDHRPMKSLRERMKTPHTQKKLKKTIKESSAVRALKPNRPKPTNPKPFRLRTEERGILKERILLEKQSVSKMEISAVPSQKNEKSLKRTECNVKDAVMVARSPNVACFKKQPVLRKEMKPVPSQKNEKNLKKTIRIKSECNAKEVVMVANPNVRLREAMCRKDSRLKCPQTTIPPKPSRPGVSRSALILSTSKRLIDTEEKAKAICTQNATQKQKVDNLLIKEKTLTSPKNKKPRLNPTNPQLFRLRTNQEKGILKETNLEKQKQQKGIRPTPLRHTVSSKHKLIASQLATQVEIPLKSTKSQFVRKTTSMEGTQTSTKITATDQLSEGKGCSSYSTSRRENYGDGYKVTAVLGDGRCLFRAIAHVAFMRNGGETPNENLQRDLADELRARVVDELLKRREDLWFIEGDFDEYVKRIRYPFSWGGATEILMASHVLKMMISVYMIDRASGKLLNIANYGEEYRKEEMKPVKVLFHEHGHYEILETFADLSCQKKEIIPNNIYKMEPYQTVSPEAASLQGVYG